MPGVYPSSGGAISSGLLPQLPRACVDIYQRAATDQAQAPEFLRRLGLGEGGVEPRHPGNSWGHGALGPWCQVSQKIFGISRDQLGNAETPLWLSPILRFWSGGWPPNIEVKQGSSTAVPDTFRLLVSCGLVYWFHWLLWSRIKELTIR